ncbi:MAG TPA: zinc ABC transporter permease, partial [Pusillimonas sp.]|nr:zinc ABC transporter permease [Pusillimonas sp.]
IMMLPAASARFWVRSVVRQMAMAALIGVAASYMGLLFSYYFDVPASASIILTAGILYFVSVVAGPQGGLLQVARQYRARRHLSHIVK